MDRILIVEDDATVRETLALNLRSEGYKVHTARDGESGMALAHVLAALRRRRSLAPSMELVADDLRVNLVTQRAFRGQEGIQLAPHEFELLATLMHNIGAGLTRELLLARVWGDDYTGDTRTVDMHVRWLRKKDRAGSIRPETHSNSTRRELPL